MLLLEQNDEWLVGRRYLSETSMTLVLAAATDHDRDREEVLSSPHHDLAASPPTITSYTTRCDLTAPPRVSEHPALGGDSCSAHAGGHNPQQSPTTANLCSAAFLKRGIVWPVSPVFVVLPGGRGEPHGQAAAICPTTH
jgi:hypothetical protein